MHDALRLRLRGQGSEDGITRGRCRACLEHAVRGVRGGRCGEVKDSPYISASGIQRCLVQELGHDAGVLGREDMIVEGGLDALRDALEDERESSMFLYEFDVNRGLSRSPHLAE